MKILMLSWEFPPLVEGGLGRHVAELAPALADEGATVHILAPHPEPPRPSQKLHPNLTVHWVNTAAVDSGADIYRRVVAVNELMSQQAAGLLHQLGGFDLIHCHDWLVGPAAIKLKLTYKCPVVATIHATEQGRWRNNPLLDDLSRKIDRVERDLTFEAWRVIACSNYMVNELRHVFALPADKLDMIPNGLAVSTESTGAAPDLAHFRTAYARPDQPLIFSVGRLVFEKGQQILIGAMPQILSHFPSARLVVAGKGPTRPQLEAIARELNVSEHVQFAGFITDAERDRLFSVADCAVFPSLYEPFGIVALEAMAFNCPVIVSGVGGLVEVVQHCQTGTVIYPDNSDSVTWGIVHVLKNPEQATVYAANARQTVLEKYSWRHIAQETIRVYRRVIAERARTDW